VHLADSSVSSGIAGFTEAILTGQEARVEPRGYVDEDLDSGGIESANVGSVFINWPLSAPPDTDPPEQNRRDEATISGSRGMRSGQSPNVIQA
jgi:hypothetical protein